MCALSHPAVEPYFPSKHKTNFSALVRMHQKWAGGLVILLLLEYHSTHKPCSSEVHLNFQHFFCSVQHQYMWIVPLSYTHSYKLDMVGPVALVFQKYLKFGKLQCKYNFNKKSLLRRLQVQNLPDATPLLGKIPLFTKIAVNFDPMKRYRCPSRFWLS